MGNIASLCCKDPTTVAEKPESIQTPPHASEQKPANHGHKPEAKKKQHSAARGPSSGTHQALRLLGRGSAADTWLFRDFKLSRPVAIKLFQRPLDYYPISAVQREVMTQTELGPGHINLINVYELFITPDHLGLVMECAEGGPLTSYVGKKWEHAEPNGLVLPEDEVLYLFKQFISAVAYCHRHNIAHRDLKLDNTLLDGSDPPILKICDFGFARHFTAPLEKAKSHLGTPEYMSPELLHKTAEGEHDSYDARSVDIWASGVLLLVCLCGAFPFDHTKHETSPTGDFESDLWTQEVSKNWSEAVQQNVGALSPEVRDLLDKIFVVDPKQRITVDGILSHAWYQKILPPKYQTALEKLAEQQREVEKHVEEQNFDRAKVADRGKAITHMVEDAGKSASKTRRRSLVRPLHVIDMDHADLESIDLTERAVLDGEGPPSPEPIPDVVKERFNRDSVKEAVNPAFSSNSNLSDVLSNGSQHRSAVGGGAAVE